MCIISGRNNESLYAFSVQIVSGESAFVTGKGAKGAQLFYLFQKTKQKRDV